MIVVAGVLAGMINTVVGSGTLITFPVLIGLGVPPVTANISNSIGLVPGGASGAWGYRQELTGQRRRVLLLGAAALIGGAGGAVLLLVLPASAFTTVAPFLIGISVVLVVIQPWLKRTLAARREDGAGHSIGLWFGCLVIAVYGGYFGAAQGVIFLALMGILLTESLQRINAVKNVLSVIVKAVAAVVFIIVGGADWWVVLYLAIGTVLGGLLGARIGRKLPPVVLRGVIVVIGVAAIVKLALS